MSLDKAFSLIEGHPNAVFGIKESLGGPIHRAKSLQESEDAQEARGAALLEDDFSLVEVRFH